MTDLGSHSDNGSATVTTLVIGVGGPTNSGKTTLAKHLLSLLPADKQSVMLHQDDFALPEAELPWNEALQARDWDHPIGTIDYRRLESVLLHARTHGQLPPHHSSHDHLNLQPERPLQPALQDSCRAALAHALSHSRIDRIIVADGFLLYYDARVRRQMDVRLFLRCDRATLEHRRNQRGGYATAEDTVWQDPPGYFEHVIWPGYVVAHHALFANDDVERGTPVRVQHDSDKDGAPVKDLRVIEAQQLDVSQAVQKIVDEVVATIQTDFAAKHTSSS